MKYQRSRGFRRFAFQIKLTFTVEIYAMFVDENRNQCTGTKNRFTVPFDCKESSFY